MRRILTILAFALGAAAAPADQNDVRLDHLFERLRASPDVAGAMMAEREVWAIWLESGDDAVNRMMRRGIEAMSAGRLDDAVKVFDELVGLAPGFAEGWNKRATAYYLRDDLEASVADIQRTLSLEPRHFGAISGMGLIFLERGDARGALDAFEAVLVVHPHAAGARARVEMLRRRLQLRGS